MPAAPQHQSPQGHLSLKVLVTPQELNHHGTVFGGAILSFFDLAASVYAMEQVKSKVMLAGMKNAAFKAPAYANECLTFYVTQTQLGRSSITMKLEAWRSVPSSGSSSADLVASVEITMVAVDKALRPRLIEKA